MPRCAQASARPSARSLRSARPWATARGDASRTTTGRGGGSTRAVAFWSLKPCDRRGAGKGGWGLLALDDGSEFVRTVSSVPDLFWPRTASECAPAARADSEVCSPCGLRGLQPVQRAACGARGMRRGEMMAAARSTNARAAVTTVELRRQSILDKKVLEERAAAMCVSPLVPCARPRWAPWHGLLARAQRRRSAAARDRTRTAAPSEHGGEEHRGEREDEHKHER